MKTVTVAAFNSLEEAELLKDRLVAAGISAEIRSEPTIDQTLDFTRVSAGANIEVPRADFETALGVVYRWNLSEKEGTRPLAGELPLPRVVTPSGDATRRPPAS